MNKKLASIRRIENLFPANNADSLEIAKLNGLGWQVVVKAGLHMIGDYVCYIESDTVVPKHPVFDFLAKQNYRIKNISLRGNKSYGLILPLKDIASFVNTDDIREEGYDLTDIIGIQKYEKPAPLSGDAAGHFPTHLIPITDEDNLEGCPEVLNEYYGPCYITSKADGSSISVIHDLEGNHYVCSRKLQVKDGNNKYWQAVRKYNVLDRLPRGYAIQAELIGKGIQGNPLDVELDMLVFNVWKLNESAPSELFGLAKMHYFCVDIGVPIVEVIYQGYHFNKTSLQDLRQIAENLKYKSGNPAEGIVVRPLEPQWSSTLGKQLSFKIVAHKSN